eukprot:642039-Pelagomonas_calceolata.AAC.2
MARAPQPSAHPDPRNVDRNITLSHQQQGASSHAHMPVPEGRNPLTPAVPRNARECLGTS